MYHWGQTPMVLFCNGFATHNRCPMFFVVVLLSHQKHLNYYEEIIVNSVPACVYQSGFCQQQMVLTIF